MILQAVIILTLQLVQKILKKQSNQFLKISQLSRSNSNRKQYCKIIYRRQAIYPKRTPVIKQHKSFINGKPYAISTLQTSFNSSTYYDKTKLLSAVKNLTPTISITKVETILNNGEKLCLHCRKPSKITFTTSCLDHVAIGVQTDSETKWFHNTAPSSSMSMTVNLYKEGKCTLKVRGRTTIDPADVGLTLYSSF